MTGPQIMVLLVFGYSWCTMSSVKLLPNFAGFLIVFAEGGISERESFFAYFYPYIQLTFLAS